jgi:hypothetical protein
MAVFKFTHSTGIVKSLALAGLLTTGIGVARADELPLTMQHCINTVVTGEFIRQRPPAVESDIDREARINTTIVGLVATCDIQFSQLSDVADYVDRMGKAVGRQIEQRTAPQPVGRPATRGPKETLLCVGNCR